MNRGLDTSVDFVNLDSDFGLAAGNSTTKNKKIYPTAFMLLEQYLNAL